MLQVYEPKRKRNTEYEFGARSAYIRPFIESLEVGQTVVIPQGDFKARDLQGSVSSMSHKLWGVGSYTTVINGDAVELLRIA
ncbi:MAG: hypothetical protein EBT64_09305 [Gammaproteobacteria bacterium]|nr:hypothetical protein [Gammaproteobacteria bacterium]